MLIDKIGIARLLPHAGDMVLLEGVLSWGGPQIRCVTATHRWIGNPLRRDGRIGILCGVEYAAQAIALHAALVGEKTAPPRRGYLASLRGVSCHTDRLDLIAGTLLVEAEQRHGESNGAIYDFAVRDGDRILLDGRACVVLEPGAA